MKFRSKLMYSVLSQFFIQAPVGQLVKHIEAFNLKLIPAVVWENTVGAVDIFMVNVVSSSKIKDSSFTNTHYILL